MRRGGDIGSDHQLVVAKLKPKLKAQKREAQPNRYDIDLLRKDGEERDDFRLECRNRFLALKVRDKERNVDEMWRDVKTVLKESADCTIRCRARRKKWMSDETWDTIKKRREAKLRVKLAELMIVRLS